MPVGNPENTPQHGARDPVIHRVRAHQDQPLDGGLGTEALQVVSPGDAGKTVDSPFPVAREMFY